MSMNSLKRKEPKYTYAKGHVYRRYVILVLRCSKRFYYKPRKEEISQVDEIIKDICFKLQQNASPQIRVDRLIWGEKRIV